MRLLQSSRQLYFELQAQSRLINLRTDDTGVNSTIAGSMGFKNGANTGDDYVYNAKGNLPKDFNKNILMILMGA